MSKAKTAPLTSADLMRAFGVTQMTVFNWRRGSATRDPIPHQRVPRGTREGITYKAHEVIRWAKKHGLTHAPLK